MAHAISKQTVVAGLVVVIAAAGGWFYFQHAKSAAPQRPRGAATRPAVGAIAHREVFGDRLEAIGTLYANESVTLTAKTQGIVRSLDFDDGQTFKKGDQIAAIDAGAEDAALNVELANVEQQKKELERMMGLVKNQNVSQSTVDNAVALVKKAEANAAAARVKSAERRIVAPFPGIVGTRRISLGALVAPGTIITTLDDISVVKLDFPVPETFMSTLKPGLDIEAGASAYPGETFKGKVVSVDSRVDPTTRSVMVRALITNDDLRLRPGMLMVVDLIKDRRESIMIPEIALLPENDQQYVFAINSDNVVKRLKVVLGRRRNGTVEVLEGLQDGDIVVTEGLQDLRDGGKIKLLNADELRGAPAPVAEAERHPG
jgi:membrane fusion protein, multidrug efflux system